MSSHPNISNTISHHTQYIRSTTIHLHPHHTTVTKHGPCPSSLTSHSNYWHAKPTNDCPRTSFTRRNPNSFNPRPHYYWNNQPIHSPPRPGGPTDGQPHSGPSSNPTNRHSCICTLTTNTNCGNSHGSPTIPTHPSRDRRGNNSSLRLRPPFKSLPTRKRLMAHQAHAYHMVDPSPWPLTGAIAALLMTSGLAIWFHFNSTILITLGIALLLLTIYQWWRDIVREGTFQGHHTPPVQKGLRYGIILFITSEVFFFLGFFWAFYHASLAPTPELGGCWPPTGIITLDPFEVPLLNTAVLLASGVTVTWAHHSIIEGERKQAIQSLFLTILLGFYFTFLQAMEYYEAPFTIADGVYGSTFFVATGFHGLHVIIGSTFLAICLLRQIQYHFTSEHHFGFEAAAWYWHFVDVVWLFLYISIYWWGS